MTTIRDLIAAHQKKYKTEGLYQDFTINRDVPVIPWPTVLMDVVSGIGGLPRGRVTEIHGAFSTGKTTLATQVAASCQSISPDQTVLYLDTEHAFDANYASALGVDLDPSRFIYYQPTYLEQAGQIIIDYVEQQSVDLIIIDSIAAVETKLQLEGEFDSDSGTQKGSQSQVMAQFLTKITKTISKGRKPALLLLNQMRASFSMGRYSRCLLYTSPSPRD